MMQVAEMQHLKSGWGTIRHNPHQGRRWIEYAASKGHPLALFSLQSLIDRENANREKRDQFMRQRFNQIAMNPIEHGYDDEDRRGAPKEIPRNFQSVSSRDGVKRALKAAMDERMQHTHTDFPSRPITELIAQVDSFVPEMDDTYRKATANVLTSNLDPNLTPRQFLLHAPETVPAEDRLNAQLALVEKFEADAITRKERAAAKDQLSYVTEDATTGRNVLTSEGLVPTPSPHAQFTGPWEHEITDSSVPTLEKLRYFETQAKHYFALAEKKKKDPKSVPQSLEFLESRAHTAHTTALVLGAKAYANQRTLSDAFDNKVLDSSVAAMRNLEDRIRIMRDHEDKEVRAQIEAMQAQEEGEENEAKAANAENDDDEADLINEPDAPAIGEQDGQLIMLRASGADAEAEDEEEAQAQRAGEEEEAEDIQYVDLMEVPDSEYESANLDPLLEDGNSLDPIQNLADELETSPALEESDGDDEVTDEDPATPDAFAALQELNTESPAIKMILDMPQVEDEETTSEEEFLPELMVASRQAPQIFPYVSVPPIEPLGEVKLDSTRMDDGAGDAWPLENNVHAEYVKAAQSVQLPYADSYLDDYGQVAKKKQLSPFDLTPEEFAEAISVEHDDDFEESNSEAENSAAAAAEGDASKAAEGSDSSDAAAPAQQAQQQQQQQQQSAEGQQKQHRPRREGRPRNYNKQQPKEGANNE